jgi:beta-glucosidase/6-phospho-beta-glucosidase/beta-galactosidase
MMMILSVCYLPDRDEDYRYVSERINVLYNVLDRSEAEAPYQCAHTILKSHARAYRIYDAEFRQSQQGRVGITIDSGWYEPKDPQNPQDVAAAERAIQFKV